MATRTLTRQRAFDKARDSVSAKDMKQGLWASLRLEFGSPHASLRLIAVTDAIGQVLGVSACGAPLLILPPTR
jgi:hypothetical protein